LLADGFHPTVFALYRNLDLAFLGRASALAPPPIPPCNNLQQFATICNCCRLALSCCRLPFFEYSAFIGCLGWPIRWPWLKRQVASAYFCLLLLALLEGKTRRLSGFAHYTHPGWPAQPRLAKADCGEKAQEAQEADRRDRLR
jgi:hypothetical protein